MKYSKLLFALMFFVVNGLRAQIVDIPDTVFLNTLTKHCNGCMNIDKNYDKKIQISEAESVDSTLKIVTYNYDTIKSFKGIESFINIKSLDIASLTDIDTLDLRKNSNLSSIIIQTSKMGHLNINGLRNLIKLYIHSNSFDSYSKNHLKKLDISTNYNLESLSIGYSALTNLNLENNKKINLLILYRNNITCLDLSHCPLIGGIIFEGMPLKTLHLGKKPYLKTFESDFISLNGINLEYCSELESLNLNSSDTISSKFKEINLIQNKKLKNLALGYGFRKVCLYNPENVSYYFRDSLTQFSNVCIDYNPYFIEVRPSQDKICTNSVLNLEYVYADSLYNYQYNYGNNVWGNEKKDFYSFENEGFYKIQLSANNDCIYDTSTVSIQVIAPPIQNSIFTDYTCTKDTFHLDAGSNFQNYLWQNGNTTQKLAVSQAGKYKVTASNLCGSITDSTVVQFIKKQLSISTPRLCFTNEAEFDVQHIQYPVLNYYWAYGNGVTENSNQPKYKYPKSGTYNANLVVDYYCFKDTTTTQVIVDDYPSVNIGDSIFICKDTEFEFNAGAGFVSYLWQDGSKNQNYTATKSGIYSVAVTNTCGNQTDSVTIKKVQLDVPNIITPNNDGLNEALQIKSQLTNPIQLNIVNRWGSEVFNATNYQNNWDANGLSDGIYYYTSNYEGCESVKGWVQVVR